MSFEAIRYDVQARVARVTLARPQRLNPLSRDLMAELRAALRAAASDPGVGAFLLTGSGAGFCAGADLWALDSTGGPAAVGKAMEEEFNPLVLALATFPKPTVAAVQGVCAGGGVGLALACDVVICAEDARFHLPFLPKLGLVPDMAAARLLAERVGMARMRALCLLDHGLDGAQAARTGLVYEACGGGELIERSEVIAERLAGIDPSAFLAFRALCEGLHGRGFAAQLQMEAEFQAPLAAGPAFTRAVAAFRQRAGSEKRTAP